MIERETAFMVEPDGRGGGGKERKGEGRGGWSKETRGLNITVIY